MLLALFACSTEVPDAGKDPFALVGELSPDDSGTFGVWDGHVYLVRSAAMEAEEPGEWGPYAVGEVWDAPDTRPIGGGLPGMPEGCQGPGTLPEPDRGYVDVGPTLPLDIGPRTFDLAREEWGDGGVDYWFDFLNELTCDCDVGTAVSLPDAEGEVLVPEPVALDGFADAWAAWEDTGTLDLRWRPAEGDTRVSVSLFYEDSADWRYCVLDDDGIARIELPHHDGDVQFVVGRFTSRAIEHPVYGTVQLTAHDMYYPTVEAR